MEINRCRGYTKVGKRCTRNSSIDGYCKQHQEQAQHHLSLPEVVICIEKHGENVHLAVERLLCPMAAHPWDTKLNSWGGTLGVRLAKAPVELDREKPPGWLYFFRDSEIPDFRKIGCTDRPLGIRLKEWRNNRLHPHLELQACWYVPFHCQWWETTIHQVLKGIRYMMDRETGSFEPYDHKRRKGKEIEWFSIADTNVGDSEAYLLSICRTVIETLLKQLYGS